MYNEQIMNLLPKKTMIYLTTVFCISVAAFSRDAVISTFNYKKSKFGERIFKKIDNLDEAMSILNEHKIKIVNLPTSELYLLSSIIQNFDELASIQFNLINKTKVRYLPDFTRYYAQQSEGPIDIGPKASQNYAVYTHELGHVVGNYEVGMRNIYDFYNEAVKTPCWPTGYSKVTHGHGARNEEFAEVFAAFVLAPDLLVDVSESCDQAAVFMKNKVFSDKFEKQEIAILLEQTEKLFFP